MRPVTGIANPSIDSGKLGVHIMNLMEDFALDEFMMGLYGG